MFIFLAFLNSKSFSRHFSSLFRPFQVRKLPLVLRLYSEYVFETVFKKFRKYLHYINQIPVSVSSLENDQIKMKHVEKMISCLKT